MGVTQDPSTSGTPVFPPEPGAAQDICGVDFAHLASRRLGPLSANRNNHFDLVLRASALNHMYAHGNANPQVEICGVLVGNVYRDESGPFLHVEAIIEGDSSRQSAGQVTFTAQTWQSIQLKMDQEYPDLRIVGWYHTHPGHGVFLSEMDVFLHESFFGLPWQVAVVYDPHSGKVGLFSAPNGSVHAAEFLIELDEPVSHKRCQMPGTLPMPHSNPYSNKEPDYVVIRKKVRRAVFVRNFALSTFGLVLFAAAGLLLGLLIREQHWQIPLWIQNMARK